MEPIYLLSMHRPAIPGTLQKKSICQLRHKATRVLKKAPMKQLPMPQIICIVPATRPKLNLKLLETLHGCNKEKLLAVSQPSHLTLAHSIRMVVLTTTVKKLYLLCNGIDHLIITWAQASWMLQPIMLPELRP